jgi:hypothetical protein
VGVGLLFGVVFVLLCWGAAILSADLSDAHAGPVVQPDLAVVHCQQAWQKLAPWSYSPELARFFVEEHRRCGLPAETWQYSFCYGMGGSEMRPGMVCRGGGMCAVGLMDCTEHTLPLAECRRRFNTVDLHDCYLSIANHCAQAATFKGRDGWGLMRKVFLPSSPDGARAKCEQRRWLATWGRLP